MPALCRGIPCAPSWSLLGILLKSIETLVSCWSVALMGMDTRKIAQAWLLILRKFIHPTHLCVMWNIESTTFPHCPLVLLIFFSLNFSFAQIDAEVWLEKPLYKQTFKWEMRYDFSLKVGEGACYSAVPGVVSLGIYPLSWRENIVDPCLHEEKP